MLDYTVVLLMPLEPGDSVVDMINVQHVAAKTPYSACYAAKVALSNELGIVIDEKECQGHNEPSFFNEYQPVAVLEGHHEDVLVEHAGKRERTYDGVD